jgi:hypothetical protein
MYLACESEGKKEAINNYKLYSLIWKKLRPSSSIFIFLTT